MNGTIRGRAGLVRSLLLRPALVAPEPHRRAPWRTGPWRAAASLRRPCGRRTESASRSASSSASPCIASPSPPGPPPGRHHRLRCRWPLQPPRRRGRRSPRQWTCSRRRASEKGCVEHNKAPMHVGMYVQHACSHHIGEERN